MKAITRILALAMASCLMLAACEKEESASKNTVTVNGVTYENVEATVDDSQRGLWFQFVLTSDGKTTASALNKSTAKLSSSTATALCLMSRRISVPKRCPSSQLWKPSSNLMFSLTFMVTVTMRTTSITIRFVSTITRHVTTTRRVGTISTSSDGWAILWYSALPQFLP